MTKHRPAGFDWPMVSVAAFAALALAEPATAATEKVLYSFTGGADGENPDSNLVFDSTGTMYGSTQSGGSNGGGGTLYFIPPAGPETVLYAFGYTDGAALVQGEIVRDKGGDIFGSAYGGGVASGCAGNGSCGLTFKVSAGGTETNLHPFAPGQSNPLDGVTLDSKGNAWGVATYGGELYKITTAGAYIPVAYVGATIGGLVYRSGYIYGTSADDGVTRGSVWKYSISKKTLTVLHSFAGGLDGDDPEGGVTIDRAGNIYGATRYGGLNGAGGCSLPSAHGVSLCDFGTVYKIDPAGDYSVVYAFQGGADGQYPLGFLALDTKGNVFGVTGGGSSASDSCGCGAVFEITSAGAKLNLHSFAGGGDGAYPSAGLTFHGGLLYGTTIAGGASGVGTVFTVKP